ncbi:FAD-dependent oxidoreductase [Ruoffia halotolerans]|uniref:FAD-dependent oxidoreductase n=1 Tax=Ruoffia halotolerans TaxID=2748684 RepID=UPI001F29333C|nr:FAD-dependent oxidoreductase [Ruoffia halotolerans]
MPKDLAIIGAIEAQGINIVTNANTQSVKENAASVYIFKNINGEQREIQATHLLVATGRKPNIEDLNLDKVGIKVSDKGAVEVNEYLQTNLPNFFALGDINGGPQQTYISLDNYRIIRDFIYGDKTYSTDRRENVTAMTFIEPPLSQAGISENTAREQGLDI